MGLEAERGGRWVAYLRPWSPLSRQLFTRTLPSTRLPPLKPSFKFTWALGPFQTRFSTNEFSLLTKVVKAELCFTKTPISRITLCAISDPRGWSPLEPSKPMPNGMRGSPPNASPQTTTADAPIQANSFIVMVALRL